MSTTTILSTFAICFLLQQAIATPVIIPGTAKFSQEIVVSPADFSQTSNNDNYFASLRETVNTTVTTAELQDSAEMNLLLLGGVINLNSSVNSKLDATVRPSMSASVNVLANSHASIPESDNFLNAAVAAMTTLSYEVALKPTEANLTLGLKTTGVEGSLGVTIGFAEIQAQGSTSRTNGSRALARLQLSNLNGAAVGADACSGLPSFCGSTPSSFNLDILHVGLDAQMSYTVTMYILTGAGSIGDSLIAPGSYYTDANASVDPTFTLEPDSAQWFDLVYSPELSSTGPPVSDSPEPSTYLLSGVGVILGIILKGRRYRFLARHHSALNCPPT